MRRTWWLVISCLWAMAAPAVAHDAHGRSTSPPEARRIKNPLNASDYLSSVAESLFDKNCAACHGSDGKARTPMAGKLPVRPTNLTDYLMESMKDGEIHWVVTHGIDKNMPAFDETIGETERWQLVLHVRELRSKQRAIEKAKLGPYEWNLPPGFPYPNVPAGNPMTQEKVDLGRLLFYDKRLSLNQTESCAICHKQELAFTDGKPRAVGSTGETHPRGAMSLVNVAYSPVLTWANPNMRQLEAQALVPMFGDHPVELGMDGKEDLLVQRLTADPRYLQMFARAFPESKAPVSIGNVTRAISSFERTILSGDSPYDRYRRGDDPDAISASAKRGEALFFSERLECFHCHGGINFTTTIDYFDKGFPEIEFHNTGLYNLKGKYSYPEPNLGIFEFTQNEDDVGKFKAPTLRNIAVTAPYMHDGSAKTLSDAIDHYAAGGRTIAAGPRAGVGAENPNKSEFIKPITLSRQDKTDLIAFLKSLTDEGLLTNPALSDPYRPSLTTKNNAPKNVLRGVVVKVYAEDGAIALYHDAVPGLIAAARSPNSMEFIVPQKSSIAGLREGQRIVASVRRQGSDCVLEQIRPAGPE